MPPGCGPLPLRTARVQSQGQTHGLRTCLLGCVATPPLFPSRPCAGPATPRHVHLAPASTRPCRAGKVGPCSWWSGARVRVSCLVFQEQHQVDNALEHAELVSTRVAEMQALLAEHKASLASLSSLVTSHNQTRALETRQLASLSSRVTSHNQTHALDTAQLRTSLAVAELARPVAYVETPILKFKIPGAETYILDRRQKTVYSSVVEVGPVAGVGTYKMKLRASFGDSAANPKHLGLFFCHAGGSAWTPIRIQGSFFEVEKPTGAEHLPNLKTTMPSGSSIKKVRSSVGWRAVCQLSKLRGYCDSDGALTLRARIRIAHAGTLTLSVDDDDAEEGVAEGPGIRALRDALRRHSATLS